MKTIKFLSMAALALVGAVMTGCSNKDDVTVDPLQPASNVVTLKTTICLSGGETRALTSGGVKTFAADETMALVYKNTSGNTVKVVSAPLEAGDIESGSKWATFTFTLENPNKSENVTYIYPAAMAGETDVDYSNLASQDGTLATLSSNLDLATYTGAWSGEFLPANVTLDNQLAILALTLKNSETSDDITSSITEMTVSDGTNTYTVSPSSLSTIYVAIQPTTSANIEVTATDGSTDYTKSLTGKTYSANNGYPLSWLMTPVAPPTLADAFTDGAVVEVKFNTANDEWYGVTGTYNAGTSTYSTTKSGSFGDLVPESVSMTKDGNNLVASATDYNTITITFNTTTNEYTVDATSSDIPWRMISLNSITVNGTDITSTLTDATPAASSNTVTWDFSELSGYTALSGEGYENGGVTLQGEGNLNFNDCNLQADGTCTFTAPSGKKFTSIVITVDSDAGGYVDIDGFDFDWSTATWSGSDTSVSFSEGNSAEGITSIVFTLEDE